jgi:hypothetical protein
LVPWANGAADTLIDRFDARALLDFYRPPDPAVARRQQAPRSAAQLEAEELLAFERYRDLARLMCLGLAPAQGLAHAQQENVAVRAQARAAAAAAVAAQQAQAGGGPGGGAGGGGGGAAAAAAYAAVGFSYGGDEGGEEVEGEAEGEAEGEEAEDSEDEGAPDEAARAQEAAADALAAALFGVDDFSATLRWATRREQEAAEAALQRRRCARAGCCICALRGYVLWQRREEKKWQQTCSLR